MLETIKNKKFRSKINGFYFYVEFSDNSFNEELHSDVMNLIKDEKKYEALKKEGVVKNNYEYWDYLSKKLREDHFIFFSYRPAFKAEKKLRLIPKLQDFYPTIHRPILSYNNLLVIQDALTEYKTYKLIAREKKWAEDTIEEINNACVKIF